mgnify:CR=1 FL=1
MVAGMMPALADAFSVSIAQVGNLIAFYALGMALGGPPVIMLLLVRRVSNKHALVGLLALYGAAGCAGPGHLRGAGRPDARACCRSATDGLA